MNLIDYSSALLANRLRMQEFGGRCRGKKYFSALQVSPERKRMAAGKAQAQIHKH